MKEYKTLAGLADIQTELCLTEMSKGSMGVFKDRMYPIIFEIIFKDVVKEWEANENEEI